MVQTCLQDPEDTAAGKQLTTSDQLLAYLTSKYGNMDRLIPSLVLELEQLSKPKDRKDHKFLSNLSKISTTLVMIETEAAEARFECLVVEIIVKAAFPEDVLSNYN